MVSSRCAGGERAENVDFSRLPTPEAIHASPPCPNFSVAKIKARESAEDISAAKVVTRAIDKLMPRIFTLENVPKYESSQSCQLIVNTLYDLGDFGRYPAVLTSNKQFFLLVVSSDRRSQPARK